MTMAGARNLALQMRWSRARHVAHHKTTTGLRSIRGGAFRSGDDGDKLILIDPSGSIST